MATRFNPVVAEETIAAAQVSITAAYNSAGQAITSSVSTDWVSLKNFGPVRYPIEYQIGSGAFIALAAGTETQLPINLSITTLKVRLSQFSPSSVVIDVEMNPEASSDPTSIVVSATAPSNGDGRPDGTIYIQQGRGLSLKSEGAYAPAGGGKKSLSLKKGPFGRMATTTLATDRTSAFQLDLEAPFIAVRLWLPNAHTAAVSGLKAMAYPQDTLGTATGNAGVLVDWQGNINKSYDFTWGGAASASLPARIASERPSWTKSDWMAISSVPRADGGTRPLLGFRIEAPSGTVATIPFGNCDGWVTGANTDGRIVRKYTANVLAGARADWFNFFGAQGATMNNGFWPFAIEYAIGVAGEQWMGSGDSNMEGYGSTDIFYSYWMRVALRASTPAAPRDYFNAGLHSQGVGTYTAYLEDNISAIDPDVLVYAPYSVNDVSGAFTTFNADQANGGMGRAGAVTAGRKAATIVTWGLPCNAAFKSYTSDSLRRAFNAAIPEIARNAVAVSDIATPNSGAVDGNDQTQYLAGSTTDNVHLSEAGHNLAATPTVAARAKLPV